MSFIANPNVDAELVVQTTRYPVQEQLSERDQLAGLLPGLRAFLAKRAAASDVDDLMQDVLVRMQNRVSSTAIENLEAYLFQVAHSTLVDRARRNQVRRLDQHVELVDSHHPVDEISPERVLVGEEESQRLLTALRELPERTRDAIILVRYEGLSYRLVAKQLGISVSAVEKHIVKALAFLAERMQEPQ